MDDYEENMKRFFEPCCVLGDMLAQSVKFIQSHSGSERNGYKYDT